jgi:hypothetical protein
MREEKMLTSNVKVHFAPIFELNVGLIKFGILFLDAKFSKNKNSKLPKLNGCLYV